MTATRAASAAVIIVLLLVAAALGHSLGSARREPAVPDVVVREITTPDGVQHMCAITMEGGISCDWERPQLPLEADAVEVDQ